MAKKSLVNLSLDSEYFEFLKEQSKERNFEKMSDYIVDWLKKLNLEDKNIKRAILQIPTTALVDKISLQTWLSNRCREIVDHYFKEQE